MARCAHRIGSHDELPLRRYLARKPYENVYLDWLLSHEHAGGDRLFCYRDAQDVVAGAAFFGRQVALAADSPEAIASLAKAARGFVGERMIVGPRRVAEQFWHDVRDWHRPPRLIRPRQPVYALEIEPQTERTPLEVRRASFSEVDEVARNSAAMIAHELGYDARRISSDFLENVYRMIEQGMWWVALLENRLCFFCHVGPHSTRTVQLQGVWTPPALRRRGLASAALRLVCAELLGRYPTVSLYVNDFNEAAINLYRKIGFAERGELATYLF